MPLELPGADHRILLVPRDEVVEFWSEDQARLFLSRYMHDPSNMSVLRRTLAQECGSLFVHQMDDHDVVTQVARRMVGTCVAMVRVELPPVLQPGDAGGDAGWSPEEFLSNPLAALEKAIEDVIPDAIIPPEFVRMALREAEAIDWENRQYGFVIDALRHASQKLMDGSAVAPELPLLARQTGQTLASQAQNVGVALKKLAGAGIPKPDPSALGKQLVGLAGSQGTALASGAKKVGLKLVEMSGKASDVLDKTALGQEFQQGAGKQARELVNKVGDVGKDMIRLADKAGAAADPSKVGPHLRDTGKEQAGKLRDIAAGAAPALDGLKAKGELEPGWVPKVNTNEFAFVLVDLLGKPVAGQKFKITVKGAVHEGTTGGDGKVSVKGLPMGARGTLELPGSVWPWRDADGTLPGPRIHVVQKGEFLSKIAKKYGIGDWKKLYDHPVNEPFRLNRPEPGSIQVGDEIFIPDAEPRRLDFKVGTSIAITHVGLKKPKLEIGQKPGQQAQATPKPGQAQAGQNAAAAAAGAPKAAPPGEVTKANLTGFFFETDKCFLLPGAMASIKALKSMYDQHKGSEVLVVGHTDRAGSAEHNLHLSWERAEAVAAYMRDDAAAWVAWFGAGKPKSKRWGAREVAYMLSALPQGATPFYVNAPPDGADDDLGKPISDALEDAVRGFQEWSNAKRGTKLTVDGKPGPMTQRELVAAYMDIDGTTLPKGTVLLCSGLGETQPAVATADGVAEAANRRVEVFFFPKGIQPKPAPKPAPSVTKPPPKADTDYNSWEDQVHTEVDLDAPKDPPKPAPKPTPKPDTSTQNGFYLLLDTASGLVYRVPQAMYDQLAKGNKDLANIRKGIEDAKKLPKDQRQNAVNAKMADLQEICGLEPDLDPSPNTQKIPGLETREKLIREFVSLKDKKLVYTPGKLLDQLEKTFKGQFKKDDLKKAISVEPDEEKKPGSKVPFEIKWASDWKGQGDGNLLDLIDSSDPATYLPMIIANPMTAPVVLMDWVAEKYPNVIRKNHGDKFEWAKTSKRWDGGWEARFMRWAYDYQAAEVVFKPTEGQIKLEGKACGSVSLAQGKAEVSYSLPDKEGFALPIITKDGNPFRMRLVIGGAVSGFVGVQAELGYEAVADWSVKGQAKPDSKVPVQIGVGAGLKAFAGARVNGELSLGLEWYNFGVKKFKPLAKILGEGTAYAGVAAEFVFHVGWDPKKGVFTFEVRAGVALKLGAGAAAKGEADVNEIITFIGELIARTDFKKIGEISLEAFQAFTKLCLGMAVKAYDTISDSAMNAVLAVGDAFSSWSGEQAEIRKLAENINQGRSRALIQYGPPEAWAQALAKLCDRSMVLSDEPEEQAICRILDAIPTRRGLEKTLERVDPKNPTVQGGIAKIDSAVDWGEQDRFDAVLKKHGLR